MSRKILFRGWNTERNEMIPPSSLTMELRDINSPYWWHVVFQQYTGLDDRNGNPIFEGDIVKWGDLPNSSEFYIRVATVEMNPDIQFNCKNIPHPYIFKFGNFAYDSQQLEVIGNVYCNPELIKTDAIKEQD
jgi:uncharacterized phage protein (TIGR01671 family)